MNSTLTGYLLYHPQLGVYLGHDDRQHYWSKVNPGSLTMAIVFPEIDEIRAFVGGWPIAAAAVAIPITSDRQVGITQYATMGRCVEAGVTLGWLGRSTPCLGPIH